MMNVFAVGDCSNRDAIKAYTKLYDQLPTVITNIESLINGKPPVPHKRGVSLYGKLTGPPMVGLGSGHKDAYGVGPNLPGCSGCVCWTCCCFGYPCSVPAGHASAKAKTEFNHSMQPKKGKGITDK